MDRIAQQYRSGKRDNNGNRMASSAISEKGHIQVNQTRTPGQMPVYRGETINLSNLPKIKLNRAKIWTTLTYGGTTLIGILKYFY